MLAAIIQAANMIAHKDAIFSSPKKTYPVTEKQKRMVANAAKVNAMYIVFVLFAVRSKNHIKCHLRSSI